MSDQYQPAVNEPAPVSELDKTAQEVLNHVSRTQRFQAWGSYTLLVVAFAAIGLLLSRSFSQDSTITSQQHTISILVQRSQNEQQRIEADIAQAAGGSCLFYRLIGTLPVIVTPTPSTPRTGALGVNLVVTARDAYFSFGCPRSEVGPVPAGLKTLGKLYHIKIMH
jgi:hypothetical protein